MSANMCIRNGCVVNLGATAQGIGQETAIPDTIDIGQFNQFSVEQLVLQYNTGIVTGPNFNDPINLIVKDYGEEPFYESVAALNIHFNRDDVKDFINKDAFPFLTKRIDTGIVFSPIEVAEFIRNFGYTPSTLSVQSAIATPKLSSELEAYYAENFSASTMESFCNNLPKIFGAVVFFTALVGNISNIISKLKNFALDFSLSNLLNQLKDNILNVIDKVIEKIKNQLENFSIKNVINEVNSVVNEAVSASFHKIKETAEAFFDNLNIENLKQQIEGLIDYATNIFKDPKIEEIQYLLLRFCSFISSLENGINQIIKPVDDFVNSYKSTVQALTFASDANTARAIRAGAIRYASARREQGINTVIRTQEQYGNPPALTAQDFEGITPWNNGNGDSRIRFIGRWPSVLGRDGWERVDQRVRAQLMQVQRVFGKQLNINSGWRSSAYNSSLRGAARNSLHLQGLALDISWSGYNSIERESFIEVARYYGFKGIGRYAAANGNFVHIDVGRARQWTGSAGLPSDDAFRTGANVPNLLQNNNDLEAFGGVGATPSTSQQPLFTADEAANLEYQRSFDPNYVGSTPGERRAAEIRGYTQTSNASNTTNSQFSLSDVGSYVTYDEFGNRTIRDLSGNPITQRPGDEDSTFSLSDVR